MSQKEILKNLALEIRKLKAAKSQPVYECIEFRHRHIALCLARGRTMEQIENVDRSVEPYCNHKPKQNLIDKYLEECRVEWEAKQAAKAALKAGAA